MLYLLTFSLLSLVRLQNEWLFAHQILRVACLFGDADSLVSHLLARAVQIFEISELPATKRVKKVRLQKKRLTFNSIVTFFVVLLFKNSYQNRGLILTEFLK